MRPCEFGIGKDSLRIGSLRRALYLRLDESSKPISLIYEHILVDYSVRKVF